MAEAEMMCTRLGIMQQGRLIQLGNIEHLRDNLHRPYTLKVRSGYITLGPYASGTLGSGKLYTITTYSGTSLLRSPMGLSKCDPNGEVTVF